VSNRLILGIESSCDETSASVVRNGTDILSNVVASQLIHADYGGVVPELASREHLRNIVPVVREALARASAAAGKPITYADLSAIAVTEGPGLAGALLVGITFAKAAAFAANKPLIAVNHLEGHIHAVLMQADTLGGPFIAASCDEWGEAAPLLALVVSGGHTHLYLATRTPQATWHYRNVGKTLDDAAGEAYDKVAKLLGLPYPGGPWMDALAAHGTPDTNLFPFTQIKQKATGNTAPKLSRENLDHEDTTRFDLSFSGIKTAVRRYVELHAMQPAIAARATALRAANLLHAKPSDHLGAPHLASETWERGSNNILSLIDTPTLNLIASFQHAVIKNLARATFQAAAHFGARGILVSGGVSANRDLRLRMSTLAAEARLPLAFPTVALSTDNAAMIAAAAFPKLLTHDFAPTTLEPTPQLRLG
jgi:N6-L-threonylcarbamoyladenine synthase